MTTKHKYQKPNFKIEKIEIKSFFFDYQDLWAAGRFGCEGCTTPPYSPCDTCYCAATHCRT